MGSSPLHQSIQLELVQSIASADQAAAEHPLAVTSARSLQQVSSIAHHDQIVMVTSFAHYSAVPALGHDAVTIVQPENGHALERPIVYSSLSCPGLRICFLHSATYSALPSPQLRPVCSISVCSTSSGMLVSPTYI